MSGEKATAGGTAVFHCNTALVADVVTPPVVTLRHPNPNRTIITPNSTLGGQSIFLISPVRTSDAGVYVCMANLTIAGTNISSLLSSTNATLNVSSECCLHI